jgi:hypothetical protein
LGKYSLFEGQNETCFNWRLVKFGFLSKEELARDTRKNIGG